MNKFVVFILCICAVCFSCNSSSVSEETIEKTKMDSILRIDSIKASQSDLIDSVLIDSNLL